jgi:hypothetical protein
VKVYFGPEVSETHRAVASKVVASIDSTCLRETRPQVMPYRPRPLATP